MNLSLKNPLIPELFEGQLLPLHLDLTNPSFFRGRTLVWLEGTSIHSCHSFVCLEQCMLEAIFRWTIHKLQIHLFHHSNLTFWGPSNHPKSKKEIDKISRFWFPHCFTNVNVFINIYSRYWNVVIFHIFWLVSTVVGHNRRIEIDWDRGRETKMDSSNNGSMKR